MKILKVVSNGFKLCEKDFTISFVPQANKSEEDKEFELHEIDEGLFIHKTIGVIGKNASGKTTVVDLLTLVYDIFSNFRIKRSLRILKYWHEVINLDITFYHEGYLYRYVTEIHEDNDGVSEKNYKFREQKLYKRIYMKSYSKNLFDYAKYELINFEIELPEDTSILYLLLKNIISRGLSFSSEDSFGIDYFSALDVYKVLDNGVAIIKAVLKMFDEHIENIETIKEDRFKIVYYDNKIKEVSNKELYDILSSGTNKGIYLYAYVVFSLMYGVDFIIDEIENHFHKMLVESLINLYKDTSVNKNHATLIFTTHYCELLDLFNRSDNIYITKYKNEIKLENVYKTYRIRPELSKSNKFYSNAFDTNINYDALMNFKKELM